MIVEYLLLPHLTWVKVFNVYIYTFILLQSKQFIKVDLMWIKVTQCLYIQCDAVASSASRFVN